MLILQVYLSHMQSPGMTAVDQCRIVLDLDWVQTNEALAGTAGYL